MLAEFREKLSFLSLRVNKAYFALCSHDLYSAYSITRYVTHCAALHSARRADEPHQLSKQPKASWRILSLGQINWRWVADGPAGFAVQ